MQLSIDLRKYLGNLKRKWEELDWRSKQGESSAFSHILALGKIFPGEVMFDDFWDTVWCLMFIQNNVGLSTVLYFSSFAKLFSKNLLHKIFLSKCCFREWIKKGYILAKWGGERTPGVGSETQVGQSKTQCPVGWVAQLAEHPTLDFASGHDPRVVGSSPVSGSVLSVEPAWDSLFLSAHLLHMLSF